MSIYSDLSPQLSSLNLLKDLRVCFLTGTLGPGGAERQLHYILKCLKEAGSEVILLSLTRGEHWEKSIAELGVPVKYVGAQASRLRRLLVIMKAVRQFRPTIVQSQHFYVNGYAAMAGSLCGARTVGAVRGDGFSDLHECGRPLGKLCLYLPQLLAVNSRAAMRNLVSLGGRREKLRHLPNVIDLTQFRPPASRNGHPVTILGVGRLGAEKRFDRFLRVMTLLRQSCATPFKALIAGDGELRAALAQSARDSGFSSGVVEFCGNVSDIRLLFQTANLLFLPSDREGTPNVVMEAMACGLPVVATAVGDVPDLVQHGETGFVVDRTDEAGAARHLANLLNDDVTREGMGNCARAFIQSHHALEALPGHLVRLYSETLQ